MVGCPGGSVGRANRVGPPRRCRWKHAVDADGHVTLLVLTTRENLPKAELVGERAPDFCLGNPEYRMITIVKFGKHSAPIRSLIDQVIRHHLEAEAEKLQKRYAENKIEKSARADVFAVADFDGTASSQLGGESPDFRVFVFNRAGKLLQRWDEVPDAVDLAAALK
jgi:hypothetical protein